jgi:hypothetical protein
MELKRFQRNKGNSTRKWAGTNAGATLSGAHVFVSLSGIIYFSRGLK